jgi:hypothetical protein
LCGWDRWSQPAGWSWRRTAAAATTSWTAKAAHS